MAGIVELTYPDNVTLVRGAMQNWRDLEFERTSASVVAASLIPQSAGRVLVVGAHHPPVVRQLAERSAELTVVTRGIPDAAEIGAAAPTARVLAGCLDDVVGTFDLVLALEDLSLVQSSERPTETWAGLAARLTERLAPGGSLLLGIENERGLHRASGADDPYVRNRNADWTPFATWDATRPRTLAQVRGWTARLDTPWTVLHVLGPWTAPSALVHGDAGDLSALWMGRSAATSVLALRSAALADHVLDHVAGWVVRVGPQAAADSASWLTTADGRWALDGTIARLPDGRTLAVPEHGRTPLVDLVELAADTDTPGMRALLHRWYQWLESSAEGGTVPAAFADARLGNLVPAGDGFGPLAPGENAAPLEQVAWDALGDALGILTNQGLRHPWPTATHRETRLAALGAMAGVAPPADLALYLRPVQDTGQSRGQLLAVTRRQQEELRSAWARLRWDEKQYAAWRAVNMGKRAARYARKHGRSLPKKASKRALMSVRAKLR